MTRLRTCRLAFMFLLCVAAGIPASAQNTFFTTLFSFSQTDGSNTNATLVLGTDGNLYGATFGGGAYGLGTIFKTTIAGSLTTLYNFCSQPNCPDGSDPSGLVEANDGNFYGATFGGGTSSNCGRYGCGTVFKITPSGELTTLHSFDGADGAAPWAGLMQASSGNFYGTTELGGTNGAGTVFQITPAGAISMLYSFCSQPNCTDGGQPTAPLMQATDGNLYGTTAGLGTTSGTVFKITMSGILTTLYNFCSQPNCTDGAQPQGGLVQADDGNFYGTTFRGGLGNYGTVFKITPEGVLITLHDFNGSDGYNPFAGLAQARDGNFYGTTSAGGTANDGTVFKITPEGVLTTLHNFERSDGYWPYAGLVQASNGAFFGATSIGGPNGWGTIFRLGLVHTCATCRP